MELELDQNLANDAQPAAAGAVPTVPRSGADVGLGMIMDIPITLTVEVGQARMSIGRLLALGQGAVVELDRVAGEPLDVLANGTLVARGEVVVVEDKFGIRLTEVVSPTDRAKGVR